MHWEAIASGGSPLQEYANLFAAAPDDAVLIESVNQKYGSNIVLEDFRRSYTWVMNVTMNEYMFSDPATKNAADLAAWAGGEPPLVIVSFARRRASGNRNSIYYKCIKRMFRNLCRPFCRQANWEAIVSGDSPPPHEGLDSMPDVAGVGVFDGELFAVYVGGGQVIFPSADCGFVVKEPLGNWDWTCWCTFDAVTYPPEVYAALNPTTEDVTE